MGGIEYGTAGSAQVLEGYTIATTVGLIEGAMRRNDLIDAKLESQNASYSIPEGYHDGNGKVTANITDLIPANIKKGVNVGGVEGAYEGSGGNIVCADNKLLSSGFLANGSPYLYNESLDKFTIKLEGLDEQTIPYQKILATSIGGSIDFSKYNTLTIGMTIKKVFNYDSYLIRIYCGASNLMGNGILIRTFVIEGGTPKERIISETFDISHINIEGSLRVKISCRSDSTSKTIDSYEIYELELK